MAYGKCANRCGLRKHLAGGLLAMVVLFGGTGLNCSSETYSVFRETATSEIGDGVKTIVNGILDGIIAALSNSDDTAASG